MAELRAAGLDVVRGPASHDLPELRDPLRRAVAWIAGAGPVTEAHLALAPGLRILARYGAGVDAVDLDAAAARGVVVTNTPGANSEAVADHAIGLLLALLRGVVTGDRGVRAGDWQSRRGRELRSLTVGVVGFGHVGRAVARRLACFGSSILIHDPFVEGGDLRSRGLRPAPLAELVTGSDAVSLHAPGGRCLVDVDWLEHSRSGQLIVNTARADLVDEAAVAGALRSGRLGGYAADVLGTEMRPGSSPLLAGDLADLVVITPHTAAHTVEAIDRMSKAVTVDVLAVLAGRQPLNEVRLAEVR